MNKHFDVETVPDDIFTYTAMYSFKNDPNWIPITKRELRNATYQQTHNKTPGFDEIDS